MSMAFLLPFVAALPTRASAVLRLAARHRRWLAAALVIACAVHGTWRGVALHIHQRDEAAMWSERFAALHGAMALANVIANLADEPGEWSLVWLGDGRSILRKGGVIRVLPVTVTKPDFSTGVDEPPAKISLPKGEGAVPIVEIAGGSRSLCYNLLGNTPSNYLGRRLELGTYVAKEWKWTQAWAPPRRIHQACDELPSSPEADDADIPPRIVRSYHQSIGLRVGPPAKDPDPRTR
jgi:hypothetical protein